MKNSRKLREFFLYIARMDTWQPRNFAWPSQAVVDADLTLAVRSHAHGQQPVRSHLLFPRNASHFRGPQRSSLDACEPAQLPLSLSLGLLLQCSPKFVLPVSILYQNFYLLSLITYDK